MDEIPSIVITFILLVFMVIVGPIFNTFQAAEKATDSYVNVVTNRFQKEVRNNGYVDYNTYLKFRTDLLKTKRIYTVEMIHERVDALPEDTNGYGNYFVQNSTNQILSIIERNKKYEMSYGDNFTVIVKERNMSSFKSLNMIISNDKDVNSRYIFAKDGGMVQNEE